jgi:hypothetical protein
VVHSAAH